MTDRLPGFDPVPMAALIDCGVTCQHRPGDIVAMCDQGSAEWLGLRRGCLTASACSKVIGIKGEPSKSATRESYLYELAAEIVTGGATENYVNAAMQRGTAEEPHARAWYETRVRPVREVGFVFRDESARNIGASPDGLCADRGLEIKVLLPANHCRYLCAMSAAKAAASSVIQLEHRMQCQFAMWVTGIQQWDYLLYQPDVTRLPSRVVTIHADEKLHAACDKVLPDFMAEVTAAVETIRRQGND